MFRNFTISFVDSDVYLGDVLAAQRLEKSVELTINKRLAKVKGAMFEMQAILEDFQMQALASLGYLGSSHHTLASSKLRKLGWAKNLQNLD